jgi:hypothetical protein
MRAIATTVIKILMRFGTTLNCPAMGLQLAQDVASGYTGVITLKDESGETTGGLPSSGSSPDRQRY